MIGRPVRTRILPTRNSIETSQQDNGRMLSTPVESVSTVALIALLIAAFAAGWIDSVVGGGGLIQLPALIVGFPNTPTPLILGTNKLASFCGTFTASAVYIRQLAVSAATLAPLMAGAYAGSSLGALASRHIPRTALTPIVLIVVVLVGLLVLFRPHLGLEHSPKFAGTAAGVRTGGIGVVVGFYDGLIGPGTGSFFVISLVCVLGFGFLEASVYAKLANLTTNVAALVVYGVHGDIMWAFGIALACANVTGGFFGARMALRHGSGFVRKVFLCALAILVFKLAWDTASML